VLPGTADNDEGDDGQTVDGDDGQVRTNCVGGGSDDHQVEECELTYDEDCDGCRDDGHVQPDGDVDDNFQVFYFWTDHFFIFRIFYLG